MDRTLQNSKKSFMKGIDPNVSREKRSKETLSIRKKIRDENLLKRRGIIETIINNDTPSYENISYECIKNLYSKDYDLILDVLNFIRKQVSTKNPSIDEIIEINILPRIIELLNVYSRPDIQLQCCWIITNITASDYNYWPSVSNSIDPMIQIFLTSYYENVREQALWSLGNIISDRHDIIDKFRDANILNYISYFLSKTRSISFIKTGIWVACNIIRAEKSLNNKDIVKLLNSIKRILIIKEPESFEVCFWILEYIISKNSIECDDSFSNKCDSIKLLVDNGFIPILISCLSEKKNICLLSVKILGHIIGSENDGYVQDIIDCGFIIKLKDLFLMYKDQRKEYCWIISNIVAGPQEHTDIIVKDFLPIIRIALHEMNFETKKEVVWILYNIVYKNNIEYLKPILEFLDFIYYFIKKDLGSRRKCLEIIFFVSSIDNFRDDNILNLAEELLIEDDDELFDILQKIINQYK